MELLHALDLEPVDGGFVGQNLTEGPGGAVVFGGQLLAQTVVAAARTLPEKEVLSLQTVFARGARPDRQLDISVETMSNGRSFGSVTVSIEQGGKVCVRSQVLLHSPDADLVRYGSAPPPASAADALPERGEVAWWDIRYDADIVLDDPDALGPPTLDVWSRFPKAPTDPVIAKALLGYASDAFLLAAAMRPHRGIAPPLAHVSVDTTVVTQTLSFHEPFDASQWLLLAHESPYAGRGRSFGRADVFTEDGRLVASYVQNNMLRAFPEERVS
jgi:acyl-CoA thioesterase-2